MTPRPLCDAIVGLIAAIVLIVAINAGGPVAIIAGVCGAVFALACRALGVALLASLEPRTRHERRAMHRIQQDISKRIAELKVVNGSAGSARGGA